MMNRPIRDGFSLVWRHQRLVWWIFIINLFLGFLASIAPRLALLSSLDHSLYSDQLSQRFDIAVFIELLMKPEVSLGPAIAGSAVISVIFLFYMLFLSGGILTVYTDNRKLSRGEFFESCGTFFWRMLRLLLCSIIPFAIAFALLARVQFVSDKMASDAPSEMQGFWVQVIGSLLCLLLVLFIRAWFDVAQAHTVREAVRGMFFLTWRMFLLTLRNAPRLVFTYFFITLLGALLAAGAWFFWLNIPRSATGTSWLLLELLTLCFVGLRLWQRAAAVLWYENYAALHPVFVPAPPMPLPQEVVVVEATPVLPPPLDDGGQPAS
jgi:hypothetical protein